MSETPATTIYASATLTVGGVAVEVNCYVRAGGDLIVSINRDGRTIGRVLYQEAMQASLDIPEAMRHRRDVKVSCTTGEVVS